MIEVFAAAQPAQIMNDHSIWTIVFGCRVGGKGCYAHTVDVLRYLLGDNPHQGTYPLKSP